MMIMNLEIVTFRVELSPTAKLLHYLYDAYDFWEFESKDETRSEFLVGEQIFPNISVSL